MNLTETATLLTFIARIDNRTIEKATVQAWGDLLDDVALPDAIDAARTHYRETSDWLTPAMIRERVRTIRTLRIERAGAIPAPAWNESYTDVLRASLTAVADGWTIPPAIHAAPPTIAWTGHHLIQQIRTRKNQWTNPCPYCRASPGTPCTGPTGKPKKEPHPSRNPGNT
jgi:hypothetical protein